MKLLILTCSTGGGHNSAARAIWQSCGYTGFTTSGDSHYDNIRDLTVFGAGD